VQVHTLLQSLGTYAMMRAGGMGPGHSKTTVDAAGYHEGLALLQAMQGERPYPRGEPMDVAGLFAAYPMAHFLSLDTRSASFGVLLAEVCHPDLRGFTAAVMRKTAPVVAGHGDQFGEFLVNTVGATRETWMLSEPEERIRLVARATLALMRRPDAVPAEPDVYVGNVPGLSIESMERIAALYDSIADYAQRGLPSRIPPYLVAVVDEKRFPGPDDALYPDEDDEEPATFIERKLADPEFQFVLWVSEQAPVPNDARANAVLVRVIGRTFEGQGSCVISQDRTKVTQTRFLIWKRHNDGIAAGTTRTLH